VDFATPEISYAQPLDGGRAGLAYRSLDRTVAALGPDGPAWRRLFEPLIEHRAALGEISGNSLVRFPQHPFVLARFGLRALEQGSRLWNQRWSGDEAPGMLTGVMAHGVQPLPSVGAAAAGLTLATYAHAGGWPVPIGGSQAIVDAMVDDLRAYGGTLRTDTYIQSIAELPSATVTLFDTSARAMGAIAGQRLPQRYLSMLGRIRYGNAVAKVDFALSDPVPWMNPEVGEAGTMHLGGTRAEVALAENTVTAGQHAEWPYVLVSQPTSFDPSRAPAGKHVLWAYTHVPRNSRIDQTEAITRQIERFAPGFRDTILASSSRTAEQIADYNPNYIGGDIASADGSFAGLIARPTLSPDPWRTPGAGIYLCSSASAPGPGVHGLAGWRAALSALRHDFGITAPPRLDPTRLDPTRSDPT
jgi:phytoene dehydrogenase-like protein